MNPMTLILFALLIFIQDKAMTLDDLQWENRIVLYFPSENIEDYEPTDSLKREILERKLAYFIFGDEVISNKSGTLAPSYIDKLRSQYQLGSKKEGWVLIGLDGGVKLKKEESLDWELIFKTIDAMPMRQSEIRNGL
jgi:hypothetical protein